MKKWLILLVCACVLFAGCTPKEQEEAQSETEASVAETAVEVTEQKPERLVVVEKTVPAVVKAEPEQEKVPQGNLIDMDQIWENMNAHAAEPAWWTIDRQKESYEYLFNTGLLDEALEFRNFIESLAQYHHNEPVYEYNPVLLCYEEYPEIIPLIFQEKPDLFTRGNITSGSYSSAPIVYVLQNLGLEEVKFYFENNIPFLDVSEDMLFGTMNRGGPRFGIGGNILTYAKDPEVIEYLISKGIPTEVKAYDFFYYLKGDTLDVHSAPGKDTDIVGTLTNETMFKALSVLSYKVDGSQWMKISFDDMEGWIPQSGFNYDTGI